MLGLGLHQPPPLSTSTMQMQSLLLLSDTNSSTLLINHKAAPFSSIPPSTTTTCFLFSRINLQWRRRTSSRQCLSLPHSQQRPANNMNGDMDEALDDLFSKYGKVVFRSKEQKPASKEADDDAESLSFAIALAKVASDVKGADIKVLFVKPLVYWTRFFIIATAFSRPQIDAMGSRMRDTAEKEFRKVATGDVKPNAWTLLDFGDVVVHIFLPPQREYYNLEEFYGNATLVELPFDNQPPNFS